MHNKVYTIFNIVYFNVEILPSTNAMRQVFVGMRLLQHHTSVHHAQTSTKAPSTPKQATYCNCSLLLTMSSNKNMPFKTNTYSIESQEIN